MVIQLGRAPTVKDVARRARVSVGTVSASSTKMRRSGLPCRMPCCGRSRNCTTRPTWRRAACGRRARKRSACSFPTCGFPRTARCHTRLRGGGRAARIQRPHRRRAGGSATAAKPGPDAGRETGRRSALRRSHRRSHGCRRTAAGSRNPNGARWRTRKCGGEHIPTATAAVDPDEATEAALRRLIEAGHRSVGLVSVGNTFFQGRLTRSCGSLTASSEAGFRYCHSSRPKTNSRASSPPTSGRPTITARRLRCWCWAATACLQRWLPSEMLVCKGGSRPLDGRYRRLEMGGRTYTPLDAVAFDRYAHLAEATELLLDVLEGGPTGRVLVRRSEYLQRGWVFPAPESRPGSNCQPRRTLARVVPPCHTLPSALVAGRGAARPPSATNLPQQLRLQTWRHATERAASTHRSTPWQRKSAQW